MIGTPPTDDKSRTVNELRNAAIARMDALFDEREKIAEHVAQFDAAWMAAAEPNVDEHRSLVAAAGRLASLLSVEGQR